MPEPEKTPAPGISRPQEGPTAAPGSINGNEIEEEVRRAAVEYFDRLTEAAGRLSEQARHVYGLSHGYAADHPRGLLAGAFGVGVLLGVLMGRD